MLEESLWASSPTLSTFLQCTKVLFVQGGLRKFESFHWGWKTPNIPNKSSIIDGVCGCRPMGRPRRGRCTSWTPPPRTSLVPCTHTILWGRRFYLYLTPAALVYLFYSFNQRKCVNPACANAPLASGDHKSLSSRT